MMKYVPCKKCGAILGEMVKYPGFNEEENIYTPVQRKVIWNDNVSFISFMKIQCKACKKSYYPLFDDFGMPVLSNNINRKPA